MQFEGMQRMQVATFVFRQIDIRFTKRGMDGYLGYPKIFKSSYRRDDYLYNIFHFKNLLSTIFLYNENFGFKLGNLSIISVKFHANNII